MDAARKSRCYSEIEEIFITGSRVGRSNYNSTLPVEVVSRGEIEKMGVPTITDMVKNLTINTGSNFNGDFSTQRQSAGTSQVNLRGLTLGSTLTLVNGRRVTLSATSNDEGATFVDINQFPLLMIERVEILKDGGSAIYGSDAVAGVFNMITRKGFEGLEIVASGQTTTKSSQKDLSVSVAMGAVSDRFEVSAYFDYFDRSNLRGIDRKFFPQFPESNFNTTGLGHVPTLIFNDTPTSGPFAGSGITGFVLDPDCGVDGSIPAPFLPGADPATGAAGFCRADFSGTFDMVFEEKRFIGFSEASLEITDDLNFFSELSFAFNDAISTQAIAGPILRSSVIVQEDHPANPHGVDVVLFGRVAEPVRSERPIQNNYFRFASGFDYSISDTWSSEIALGHSEHDFTVDSSVTNLDALTVPSGDPDIPLAVRPDFNPFGSRFTPNGPQNDPAVLDAILGTAINTAESKLTTGELSVSGDLGEHLQLPGGRTGVAFGGQIRRDTLKINNDDAIERGATAFEGQAADTPLVSRNVYAAYGEVNLPIFDTLEMQVALRHESFEGQIKNTTDPKVGIQWRPVDEVLVRGSYSTAFRAPTLFQTNVSAQTTLPVASDPFNNNPSSVCSISNAATIFPASIAVGNPDLQAENADAYTAGVVIHPTSNMSVSVDYWRFEVDDVIVKNNLQSILNDDCLADGLANDPRIQRGPGGAVRSVNTQFINAAALKTDGVDFALSYDLDAKTLGSFDFDLRGTWIREYKFQLSPDGPSAKGDGNRNFTNPFAPAPKWRANASINWIKDMHNVNAIVRYISGFDDDNNTDVLNARIKSHVTLDLQYTLHLEQLIKASRGTSLSIGAINVTDNAPPPAVGVFGYETTVHYPRGRLVYVRISQSF